MTTTLVNTRMSVKRNAPIFLAISFIFMTLQIPLIHDRLSELRWYRDVTLITPYHHVVIFETQIIDEGLLMDGEMIKRRCEFDEFIAYVLFSSGPKVPVKIDTSRDPSQTSRPPSKLAESFGVWLIKWPATSLRTPIGYQIFTDHILCPYEPINQTNLFYQGKWENFAKE